MPFGLKGALTLSDLGALPAVVTDLEIGAAPKEKYVAPALARTRSGEDVLTTVRTYLDNNRNVDLTAAALWLHPNTVRYRISRFSEVTGADLENVGDLVGVWWALHAREVAGEGDAGVGGPH